MWHRAGYGAVSRPALTPQEPHPCDIDAVRVRPLFTRRVDCGASSQHGRRSASPGGVTGRRDWEADWVDVPLVLL